LASCEIADNEVQKQIPFGNDNKEAGSGCGDGGWFGWWGDGEELDALDDVEAAAAQELMDDRFGEAGGVVFYADGFIEFLEFEAADSVDLAETGYGKDCGFGGGCAVTVEYFDLSHGVILAAAIR
jgi:hypothetical protein